MFQIIFQALISKTELTPLSYLPANTNMSLNVVSIYSATTSFPENAYLLVALCTNMYPQSHTLLSTESTLGESYLLPHSHALVLVAYYPPCLWTTKTRGRSSSCTCLCGSEHYDITIINTFMIFILKTHMRTNRTGKYSLYTHVYIVKYSWSKERSYKACPKSYEKP